MVGNPKRRLSNFLLDARFQLKYTVAVVLISAIISAVLGTFLYQAHLESSRVSSLGDEDLDQALSEELAKEDRKVLLSLVAFLGGLVLALSIVGIIATHKIAGPAYAMRRTLSLIADGKFPKVRALRRGDELRSVAEELKRMADNLREREEQSVAFLQETLNEVKNQPESSESKNKVIGLLEKVIEEKTSSLAQES